MRARVRQAILVAESDRAVVEALKSDPHTQNVSLLTAFNGKEAQLILAETENPLLAVFVDTEIRADAKARSPDWISVIRSAHHHRPAMPIFATYSSKMPLTEGELRRLGVQLALQKPLKYFQMIELLKPVQEIFDPAAAGKFANDTLESAAFERGAEDASFVPIRADHFVCGTKSFFDIYARLGSGHYIKLLKAGDDFSPDRIERYLRKGVEFFYLRKVAQEQYVDYCDQIASQIAKTETAPIRVKTAQILTQGEETMNFLRTQGLNHTRLAYVSSFIGNVNELVKTFDTRKHQVLEDFLADLLHCDHAVSTVMIAGLVANQLGITSDYAAEVVGMAALFHDVGLYHLPKEVQTEDETKMTIEQKAIYYTHPSASATILKDVLGINPTVVQAVKQHHERRNQRGFPDHLGAGAINKVAEIVGIADEFSRIIPVFKPGDRTEFEAELERKLFEGFSQGVITAFRAALFPPER